MNKRTILTAVMAVAVAVSTVYAYGGGGFFHGSLVPYDELTSHGVVAETRGGFGYGVNRCGVRHGGFGIVVRDEAGDTLLGAFGGIITGRQIRMRPFTMSANLWTGIGFVGAPVAGPRSGFGYFAEATAEAGVALLPWMQVALYGGMQAMGSLDPVSIVESTMYSPVAGMRFVFGRF